MTSQLMLVIVVVTAGVVAAAVAFLRSRPASSAPAGEPPVADRTPPVARGPANAPVAAAPSRGAPAESDNSGQEPQPRASPADPSPAVNEVSGGFPPATASSPSPPEAPAAHAVEDNSDLEFTLETPNNSAGAKATTGMPAPIVAAGTSRDAAPSDAVTPVTLQPTEIFSKLFELALGKPRPASTVTEGHADVARAVETSLQDVATQERYAPRRPNMLPKILNASTDDSFSRRELAALIAQDPSLVGNLLKIANSSYYRVTPEPVESVDRAVVLLGMDGIRSLCTAALMQPIFRVGGADFPRFPEIAWEHTFRSASATVAYNFLMEQSDPFAAELLSLVMGLAKIVIFRVAMDQYTKNPRLRPDAGIVSNLLDKHTAAVARRIGASWELSEPTLAGLDGQAISVTTYPTALGRSLYFGRVVGALAVLRVNRAIDDDTAKASIPGKSMRESQLERVWTRLTYKPDKK